MALTIKWVLFVFYNYTRQGSIQPSESLLQGFNLTEIIHSAKEDSSVELGSMTVDGNMSKRAAGFIARF